MTKIKATVLLMLLAIFCFGQDSNKFINSVETSLELGLGGALFGAQVKVNHDLIQKDRLTILSGMSYSSYWAPISNYTQYFPLLDEVSDIKGFITDNHLRLHADLQYALFKNSIVKLAVGGYIGGYTVSMSGSYFHERLNVNQNYAVGQFLFDYGSRLSFNVKLTEKLGIQASLTNSLRQLGYGYKFVTTIYQYAPDNKMSLGLGLVWNLKN